MIEYFKIFGHRNFDHFRGGQIVELQYVNGNKSNDKRGESMTYPFGEHFERLVKALEFCSDSQGGCDKCPKLKECRDEFDQLCGQLILRFADVQAFVKKYVIPTKYLEAKK
jgi:hypothetical protein